MRGKDRDSSGLSRTSPFIFRWCNDGPSASLHRPICHRRTEEVVVSEETTLRKLNAGYINSYLTGDVVWYDAHLDDDFICIQSDGSVLDKPRFLFQTARGPDVARYQLDQVRIRVIGTTALVHGTGLFTTPDGHEGTSRYTDIYAKLDGRWKVVAAQVTRAMKAHSPAGSPPLT